MTINQDARIALRLSANERDALDAICAEKKITKSKLIRELIQKFLEENND